jgi:hypothetical protein
VSRGHARHQASRRRMYSSRQRELRERRTTVAVDDQLWTSDRAVAIEIEESLDFESPTSWKIAARDRASAA